MKIGIAAGGTGGHLFPAIGFFETAKSIDKETEFFFWITERDSAYKKKWAFETYSLKAIGIRKKLSFGTIIFGFYLITDFFRSLLIIFKEKPDVVIGFGGYVSVAPLLASLICGKKIFIHEQNTVPGKANLLFAKQAQKIFTGIQTSTDHWSEKVRKNVVFTGIPIRETAKRKNSVEKQNKKFTVLILGGSQGALIFNEWTGAILKKLVDLKEKITFIHICGKYDLKSVKDEYEKNGFDHLCIGFTENIGEIYAVSDLSVCRAGAGTLAELAHARIPAIVIPYPYATENHQLKNAQFFEKIKAVELVEQKDCSPSVIAEKIKFYYKNNKVLEKMKASYEKSIPLEAGKTMFKIVTETIGCEK